MKKIFGKGIGGGFTLIELLIVIAIIAILAAVVFVALNPVQRFQDARNTTRSSAVSETLTAIHLFVVDEDGVLPTVLAAPTAETQLGTAAAGCDITAEGNACGSVAACIDLAGDLEGTYIASIPVDPQGSAAETGYSVEVNANGIVTIRSCDAEGGAIIKVSR